MGVLVVSSPEAAGDGTGLLLVDDLAARAEHLLRARGYEVVSAPTAQLVLRIEPRIEATIRRGLSGDPDFGGTRPVEREEAVVRIRAIDRVAAQDVWRSSARSSIPSIELDALRSREELWLETLDAALSKWSTAGD